MKCWNSKGNAEPGARNGQPNYIINIQFSVADGSAISASGVERFRLMLSDQLASV